LAELTCHREVFAMGVGYHLVPTFIEVYVQTLAYEVVFASFVLIVVLPGGYPDPYDVRGGVLGMRSPDATAGVCGSV
jgi:hypothetical protein